MPNENNLFQFEESAFLSDQVYRRDLENTLLNNTRLLIDGQQTKWQIIKIYQRPSYFEDNGYFGIAFQNTETGKITIAQRGTELPSLKDWADNLMLGLDQIPFQGRTSVEFTQTVASQLGIDPSQIYQTGHSKGAGFAILNAAIYGSGADAFDAPGYRHLLDNIASEYNVSVNLDDLSSRVNTIYTSQDIVSKIGDNNIGNLYELGIQNGPLSIILGMSSAFATGNIPLSIIVGGAYYKYEEHSIDSILQKIQTGHYDPTDSGLFDTKIEFSFENDVKEYFKLYDGNFLNDLQSSSFFPESSYSTILNNVTTFIDNATNQTYTAVKDTLVVLSDGSQALLSSVIDMGINAKNAFVDFVQGDFKFVTNLLSDANVVSGWMVEIINGVVNGKSAEEIAEIIAIKTVVNQITDQALLNYFTEAEKNAINDAINNNQSLEGLSTNVQEKLSSLQNTFEFKVVFGTITSFITAAIINHNQGLDSQEYLELATQSAATVAAQTFVTDYAASKGFGAGGGAVGAGAATFAATMASNAIKDLFADDHFNSHQWQVATAQAAAMGVAAGIGYAVGQALIPIPLVGGMIGATIGTAIVSLAFGGKTYKPGEYPDPYSFIKVIPKTDGTGHQIIGLEREGAVLIASENGDDDIYGTPGQDIMIGKAGKNTILGYDGNDYIEGRSNDDILVGGKGDDEIHGGIGNDYLAGSEGSDNLFGDAGDDSILAGDGNDYIEGGSGNDQIEGEAGSDYINGGTGDDTILGGAGNDIIEGGDGDDTILGEDGDDIILAGGGNDIADGGAGNDIIEGGDGNDNLKGGDGDDTINGNDGIDIIYGDAGNDIINAGNSDDLVFGGIGNDIIFGSDGNDSLYGEIGNDYLLGGNGDDILDGFTGDDVIMGGKGNDVITGGDGNDTIIFLTGDGQDIIDDTDTAGSDVVRLSDANSNQVVLSKDGNDLIIQFKNEQGEITTDKITIKNEFNIDGTASSVVDRIEFADGKTLQLTNDLLQQITTTPYSLTTDNLQLTTNIDTSIQTELALGYQDNFEVDEHQTTNPNSSFYEHNYDTTANQQTDNEKFNEIEWKSFKKKRSIFGGYYNVWYKYYEHNLSGTGGNDRIVGNWWGETINGGNGDDQLAGNDGNDTIHGGAGNDLISGGSGNDSLYGEDGNDKIYGGTGNDYIDGGNDNDNLIGNDGNDTILGGAGDDRLEGDGGDDNLNLGSGNNIAYGDGGADNITSLDGKNFIDGGGDNDIINAGAGDDYITANSGDDYINAGNGNNTVFGGDGNDNIIAGSGDDYISGGSGDDTINAGSGNNNVFGNLGNDTITTGSGVDYIYGGAGVDQVKAGAGNDIVYGDGGEDWLEGEGGNDQIYGGTGSDKIFGGDGNDIIYGEAEGDILYGGTGNDQIFGGQGNDILIDDAGSDILDGGAGNDILILTKEDDASTAIDTIDNFDPDEDKIILKVNYKAPINFAIIQASMQQNGADIEINLDNGQKIIITNTNKADITEDNFVIGLSGGDDNHILFGTDGNDTLFGDDANNIIYGGGGNDELWGGLGSDALYGQGGNDILRYEVDGVYTSGNTTKNFYNNQISSIFGYNLSYDMFNGGSDQNVILMTEGNDVLDLEKPVTDQTKPKVKDVEIIYAGAGNDIINFSTPKFIYGDLTIYGGDGDDKLWSNAGNDKILGQEGNDEIYGGKGDDNIDGGVGNDVIYGGDGNDVILGSEGDDTARGDGGNDLIIGGIGNDIIDGGDGVDTVSYANSSAAINIEFNHFFAPVGSGPSFSYFGNIVGGGDAQGDTIFGIENIIGSAFDDRIKGSIVDAANNQITGGAGNDTLSGGLGNDTYVYNLGDGADTITEADFNYASNAQVIGMDTIKFGAGIAQADLNFTRNGNDLIIQVGGNNNDRITLINQNLADITNKVEYLVFADGSVINLANNLYLSQEDQGLTMLKSTLDYSIIGTAASDNISGNSADNRIYGNAGVDYLKGVAGNDTMFGGDGDDVIYGNGSGDTTNTVTKTRFDWQYYLKVNDDLAANASLNSLDAAWNHFWNYGRFEGRSFDANIDLYYSNDSNKLYGEAGNDQIFGGYGDDKISGGVGNDKLYGNSGDDHISGDVGSDLIQGGLGNDFLDGGADNDNIYGDVGNDQISAGSGDDNAYGGDCNDQIGGNDGNDNLYGNDGNDALFGDAGNDNLYGGNGDDQITGGLGNDILQGDDGNDIYIYNIGDGADIIRNSNINDAVDRIKFGTGITANSLIFIRQNNDLIIFFKNSDNNQDQIKVENHFAQSTLNKLDYIEFNDGTLLDLINFSSYKTISTLVSGTAGNDSFAASSYPNNELFLGNAGNDIIESGGGSDLIRGGAGDDTIYGSGQFSTVFELPVKVTSDYGSSFASMSFNSNPRELADVNGDGKSDIVAFASDGIYVSLGNGNGTFGTKFKAMDNYYTSSLDWQSFNVHPLMLADINGDHRDDIIGFIKVIVSGGVGDRVYTSLANQNGTFAAANLSFVGGSFSPYENVPRKFADINRDGKDDMVFFGYFGNTYAILGNASGSFSNYSGNPYILTNDFANTTWSSYDRNPRELADVNGDGKVDIVGFADDGVYVSLAGANNSFYANSNIPTYSAKVKVLSDFGYNQGWTSDNINIRKLADINGDGKIDIVGFGNDGVYVSFGNGNGTFANKIKISDEFGVNSGWVSNDRNPREVVDLNGDGKADIVGFTADGVYSSLSGISSYTDTIYGDSGNDNIFGGNGNDVINGGSGNDVIDGRNGNDTIIIDQEIGANASIDTINNFNPTQDKIVINVNDQTTFSSLQSAITQVGSNVKILLSNGQQIIINNFNKSAITASNLIVNNDPNTSYENGSNFIIVPLSGSSNIIQLNPSNTLTQNQQVELVVLENSSQPFATQAIAAHGTATINSDGSVSYIPNANFSGTDTVVYRELNSSGAVIFTKTYTIFVAGQNDAPVAQSITNLQINPEQQFSINLSQYFSDADGDNLQYTIKLNGSETLPQGISFNNQTKILSGVFATIQNLHFEVAVSDGKGGLASNDFDVNVVAPTASGANIANNLLASFTNPQNPTSHQPTLSQEVIDQISKTTYIENQGSSFSETITAENNSDNNFVSAEAGDDKIKTFSGNDIIDAGTGNDIISSGTGNDIITGGAGNDTFIISTNNAGGETTITDFEFSNPQEKIDLTAFAGIHSLNDLTITKGSAIIHLPDGQTIHILNATPEDIQSENFIFSPTPSLNLVGTSADDTLTGGDGNDTLSGGSGSDLLSAGAGDDTLVYSQDKTWGSGFVAHNIGSPDAIDYQGERITIAPRVGGLDGFDGGDGIDTIQMSDSDEALFLDDRYSANPFGYNTARIKNVETINAGGGNDIIDLTSTQFSYGNVTLNGQDGNDVLWSSSGNDTINGGSGNDNIDGGTGLDILTGGSGNDTFNFTNFQKSTINQTDIITDFTQGEDKINLHNLNYSHITFDDNPNDAQTPEGLSYHFDNDNNTIIQDEQYNFAVKLNGHINLGDGDFNW